METVHVEPQANGFVKLSICMGGLPLVAKVIPALAARELSDALGYAFNDCVRPAA